MMSTRHLFHSLLGSVLVLAPASATRAGEPREVWVQLSECSPPPYDAAQLTSFLALELSPYHLRAHVGESAPAGDTDIRLRLSSCDGADALLLRWEVPAEPPRQRVLSLRDVPRSARPRALALLISDVLRPASWAAHETAAPEESPVAATSSAPALAPVTADPFSDLGLPQRSDPYDSPFFAYLNGGLRASWVPRVGLLLYGVGLGLQGTWFQPLEWALEGSYSGGRGTVSDDVFEVDWWSAAIGLDYNLAAERRFQIGPRLSVAHVYGFADGPDDFGASIALLGGRVRISPHVGGEKTSMELLLDASYPLMTLGTRGELSPLPWTAWVMMMGVGVSLEL